jgi:protein-S-isoprenylcysteine O-methyltransferase Ste14
MTVSDSDPEGDKPPHPGVVFPPPLLFVGGFGLGWIVHREYPHPQMSDEWLFYGEAIGSVCIGVGLAIMLWGILTFFLNHTAILPNRPASGLVNTGPYKFTRNPMYLGLALAYSGGCFALSTLWPFVFLPLVLWILVRWVIRREERYLNSAFGDRYRAYSEQVRRFI